MTRWRKADPDDQSTWPPSGAEVLAAEPRAVGRTLYEKGRVDWFAKGTPDVWLQVNHSMVWLPERKGSFYWMPWSEIGDPT